MVRNKSREKIDYEKSQSQKKNLQELGLEQGKIYKFNGRFRKIYQTSNAGNVSYQERLNTYKIRNGDHIIFFDAKLRKNSLNKRRFVTHAFLDSTQKLLVAKGYEIIKVEPYMLLKHKHVIPNSKPGHYYISYKNKEEKYSGRLYIGHGERFGWINIVQLEKEKIINQFEKIMV